MRRMHYVAILVAAMMMTTAGLLGAPAAKADGPFLPYPCDIDWFCDEDEGVGYGDVFENSDGVGLGDLFEAK